MEFFKTRRSRKAESELTHEYLQKLRREREMARRERQPPVATNINPAKEPEPEAPEENINPAKEPEPEAPEENLFSQFDRISCDDLHESDGEPDSVCEMETLDDSNSDETADIDDSRMSMNLSDEEASVNQENSNLPHVPNEPPPEDTFARHLAKAFVISCMSHRQISAVLQALRKHPCFKDFPLDPRTILQTPRTSYPIENVAGGEYLHLGITVALQNILRRYTSDVIPDPLIIDFSTDGATLDAQGKIQMWPIQIRLVNVPNCKPEIVGIWRGSSKPTDVNAFFQPFIDEFLLILSNGGILYNNKLYSVGIRCFIADALARALILAHLGHKATYPCSKCWIKGISPRQGVMYYPYPEQMRLRTDEEYANRIDGEHHMDIDSPLLHLPMSLVNTPFEYMHCTCLGCMKKLLSVLISGKYAPHLKLNNHDIQIINSRLTAIKNCCPTEFARKPENIGKFSSFKATELRQLLLYTGPALFYGIVDESVYLLFLILHAAM